MTKIKENKIGTRPFVPMCIDVIQKYGKILEKPEIRVWVHPGGEDYYQVFDSFDEAFKFIKKTNGAENVPLIAIGGYELNIFDIGQRPPEKKKKTPKRDERVPEIGGYDPELDEG